MHTYIILPVVVIFFIASFVRAVLGFGSALIAMPLLAFVLNVQTATPLVALVTATMTIVILWEGWHNIEKQATKRLVASSLIGIPIGLLFLKLLPETTMKAILGVLLVLFSFYNLLARPITLKNEQLAYLFGLIAGILGGAYNTYGPPVVAYASMNDWAPQNFRATLQSYALPTVILIAISHGLAGLWTTQVFALYGYTLPAILLATWLGTKVNNVISPQKYQRFVHIFLILMGLLLLL